MFSPHAKKHISLRYFDTLNRAKIFSPFAALRGYDEEISDQDRVQGLIAKAELSEEDKGHLSDRLLQVKKRMTIMLVLQKSYTKYTESL